MSIHEHAAFSELNHLLGYRCADGDMLQRACAVVNRRIGALSPIRPNYYADDSGRIWQVGDPRLTPRAMAHLRAALDEK